MANPNELKHGDLVFLYFPKTEQWVGKSELIRSNDGLEATPTATDKKEDAALLLVEVLDKTKSRVFPQDSFRLRSTENNTGDRIYLSLDSDETFVSSSGFGQSIKYVSSQNPQNTRWNIPDTNGTASNEAVVHGVEYLLQNVSNNAILKPHDTQNRLVAEIETPPSSHWVIVPSKSLWTCEKETSQCIQSSAWQNLLGGFECRDGGRRCFNKFGEGIFFSEQECLRQCGRNDPVDSQAANSQAATSSETNLSGPETKTAPPKSKTKGLAILISVGVVVGLLVGAFVLFLASRRLKGIKGTRRISGQSKRLGQ